MRTINERSLRWRMATSRTTTTITSEPECRCETKLSCARSSPATPIAIAGQTPFDDQVLDILGVQPYKSAGLGVVVQNDSRDDENMPTRGWLFNLNNLAFRESLGGENDYDIYRAEFRYFIPHGNGNVFALRQLNHLTNDAPTAARAISTGYGLS